MGVSYSARSAAGTGWTLDAVEEYPGWSFIVHRPDGGREDVCISGEDAKALAYLILSAARYPPFDSPEAARAYGDGPTPREVL